MRRPRLARASARALPVLAWLAVVLVNMSTGGSIHPVWLVAALLVVVGAELTMAGRAHAAHRPHVCSVRPAAPAHGATDAPDADGVDPPDAAEAFPTRPAARGPLEALAIEVERRTSERGADDPETIAAQRALDEARDLARDTAGAEPRSNVSRRGEGRGSAPAAPR